MTEVEIPSPPKRPTNAYFKFRKQVYDDVKAKNPTLKLTEHTKIITEMFKALDEKKKKVLEEQFAKELAAYKDEKAKYDAKYGSLIEKKEKKKTKKSVVSDTEEESHKKKKDKAKKADNEDKPKDDKKGKKNGGDKKESKAEKEKKASKAEPEAKKGNKKK